MAQTVASFSTDASSNEFYHVFINHRGSDVKKTFASHLYYRLCSAKNGLKVFLDQPELRVGSNFGSQIESAIRTASVHVAIFSPRYAESEWCLNELLYMLESKALIIPVFYHVDPAVVRWPESRGVYAEAIQILEKKKASDPETHEDLEKPRYDPATIKKWRDALSTASYISGLDLNAAPYNGDEGAVVEKMVQLVLKEIKSESGFHCSRLYGGDTSPAVWNDGTYSGIRRITMTADNSNFLTSVQLHYGLQGGESVKDKYIKGNLQGSESDVRKEYDLNYPEEIVTKISGYYGFKERKVIKSLTFHTNQRKLGPCGEEEGRRFQIQRKTGGKIVGLFGKGGHLVDAIGAYMLNTAPRNEEFYCSQLYGGRGGCYWNDGTYAGIRRIITTRRDNWLASIQVEYAVEGDESVEGKYIRAVPHGSGAHDNRTEFNLNYPKEFVTKISGRLGKYALHEVIISLTFHTNQRDYGPCGLDAGGYFETEAGKIVGLFGSSGDLLDSIGLYMVQPRSLEDNLTESDLSESD